MGCRYALDNQGAFFRYVPRFVVQWCGGGADAARFFLRILHKFKFLNAIGRF